MMPPTPVMLGLVALIGLFLVLAILLVQWREIVELQRDVAALKGDDTPAGRHGGDPRG